MPVEMTGPWSLIKRLDGKRVLIYLAFQTGLLDVALGRIDGFGKGSRLAGEIQIHPATAKKKRKEKGTRSASPFPCPLNRYTSLLQSMSSHHGS
jgi:hypothetical protein